MGNRPNPIHGRRNPISGGIALPDPVQQQRLAQIHQANQLYSMAFQIYIQQLTKIEPIEADVEKIMQLAKFSIAASKFFNVAVQKDVGNETQNKKEEVK